MSITPTTQLLDIHIFLLSNTNLLSSHNTHNSNRFSHPINHFDTNSAVQDTATEDYTAAEPQSSSCHHHANCSSRPDTKQRNSKCTTTEALAGLPSGVLLS